MADGGVSFFDEKSGFFPMKTEFGRWWQTVFEIHIEVDLPPNTRGKECKVELTPSEIHVSVKGETKIKVFVINYLLFLEFKRFNKIPFVGIILFVSKKLYSLTIYIATNILFGGHFIQNY